MWICVLYIPGIVLDVGLIFTESLGHRAQQKLSPMQVLGSPRKFAINKVGAQWLSGRVLDSRPKGRGFKPHLRHCAVVLEQDTFILAYYWSNAGRPVPI